MQKQDYKAGGSELRQAERAETQARSRRRTREWHEKRRSRKQAEKLVKRYERRLKQKYPDGEG